MRVLNLGSINLDYFYTVPYFVQPGETLHATHCSCEPGGKGLNQSIALARAGMSVMHAGCVGQEAAKIILPFLKENKVNTDRIALLNQPTGHSVIQVNTTGDNCIVLFGGTNFCFDQERIVCFLEGAEAGDVVLLQNETNNIPLMIEEAAKRHLRVVLNAAPATPDVMHYPLNKVELLIVNEVEGQQLTNHQDLDGITRTLLQRYPHLKIVLTLGKDGVCYADAQQRLSVPASPVAAVVDTTSAGDTFVGYFLSQWLKGVPLEHALHHACEASALCIQRSGSAASIPWEHEFTSIPQPA